MIITTKAIAHNEQRYPTVGDWQFESAQAEGQEEVLRIKVSKLSNWHREVCIAVHEIVEALLCKHDGVTQEQVDEFDMNFEANRKDGDDSEPGDNRAAPYYRQHQIATVIERLLSVELGVDWLDYERELMSLP